MGILLKSCSGEKWAINNLVHSNAFCPAGKGGDWPIGEKNQAVTWVTA